MDAFRAFEELFSHNCSGKYIKSSDDARNVELGWKCNRCGESWHISLGDVRMRRFPAWATELIRTKAGREAMAGYFNGSILVILDEEDFLSQF